MAKKNVTPIDYNVDIEQRTIDDLITSTTDEEILERTLTPGKKKKALIDTIVKEKKEERKTCRLPLLLKASVYNRLKDISDTNKISMNELVTRIIINALDGDN